MAEGGEGSAAKERAETALREWKRVVDTRDQLVLAAHTAGININQIHTLTEISRSTIYRILRAQ
ncbi:helix-turn-helix domain-containing protein (plasmid) [Gordonia pseudamarae]|jgi:transcriptional regulator of acetoin/glycerol metabolism|uniref:helix-turn-helix domain-containing protein n=1 Tax=Gordonia pseudamarae TaxID=2831662 RepID=UPI001AF0EEAE|nr:helix-turn-helix domain-containing protein [Gordonia pseudamarae]QHN28912.1 helix-turn-helix domain-containing protein [Gordonia pseudamarae]HMT33648.1 helix-turn-helix domain-containing protein [Dermatophilaceae bacterium]